jgi:hypothetical protein
MMARLFEAHWQHIPSAANTILKWIVEKITPNLDWKEFGVRLTPPKIADNMDHLMMLMQLFQSGEVSPGTMLGKIGLDRAEEQRRKGDDTIQSAKTDVKTQSELDKVVACCNSALQQAVESYMASQQGGAPPAGAPPGMAPPPADPVAQVTV